MRQPIFKILLIILISIPLILPFLHHGYPQTHDGTWAVIRLVEMRRELKDLQIPPRWSGFLNHGFGYPLFLFTYPLPYLLGQIFYLPITTPEVVLKILFILSIFFSGISMYYFGRHLWGEWGGILSSVLYLYAPYRLINLYQRGSIGELIASVFYPLLFLFFKKLIEKPDLKNIIIPAFLLGGLILSHNASLILFLPFLGCWVVFLLIKNKQKFPENLYFTLAAYISGFCLTAFFWLPAFIEKKYIALNILPLADKSIHFLTFPIIFGYQIHQPSGLFLQIGGIHILLAIISIASLYFINKKLRSWIMFFFISCVIALFLTISTSNIFWKLPFAKEIDFPWRTLGVTTFFISIISGNLVNLKKGKYITFLIFIFLIVINFSLIKTTYSYKPESFYQSNDATTTSNDELMPVWVKIKPKNRYLEKIEIPKNVGNYQIITDKSNYLKFQINLVNFTQVKINTLYFPGWQALVDKKNIPLNIENSTGRMMFELNSGKYNVELKYKQTTIESVANIISLIMGISLLCIIIYLWKKPKKLFL